MIRVLFILLLCFVVVNLFVGLVRIVRGRDKETNAVVRSLTIRVAASLVLFALILVTVYLTSHSA